MNQLTRLTRRILRVGPQLAECGGTFLTEIAHIHDEVVRANDLYWQVGIVVIITKVHVATMLDLEFIEVVADQPRI